MLVSHSRVPTGDETKEKVQIIRLSNYQMIELFILLQLIQVLTPDSNLINFYEDQKEVQVCMSISHK